MRLYGPLHMAFCWTDPSPIIVFSPNFVQEAQWCPKHVAVTQTAVLNPSLGPYLQQPLQQTCMCLRLYSFWFLLCLKPCTGGFVSSRTHTYTAEVCLCMSWGPGARAHCVTSSPTCFPSLNLKGPSVTHQVLRWTWSVSAFYLVASLPRWQPWLCMFDFDPWQAEQVFVGPCSLQQSKPLTLNVFQWQCSQYLSIPSKADRLGKQTRTASVY